MGFSTPLDGVVSHMSAALPSHPFPSTVILMYKNSFFSETISLFFSADPKPLQSWDKSVRNGHIKRLVDHEIQCSVLELHAINIDTVFISCPLDPSQTLAIRLPVLVLLVKNLDKYFGFSVQVLDSKGVVRRFRATNDQSMTEITPELCSMPLRLDPGWNSVTVNLADFTTMAFGTEYVEIQRLKVHANCRLRQVYLSEKIIPEESLKPEFKLYFPLQK